MNEEEKYQDYKTRVNYFMGHGDSFVFSHRFVCTITGIEIERAKRYMERFKKEYKI